MRRRLSNRLRGWALLVVSAPPVAAAGIVSALFPGRPFLLGVATVGAAVFAVVAGRGQVLLTKHDQLRVTLPDSLLVIGPGGRLPLVRDVDDALAVRVHPAEAHDRGAGRRRGLDRVPPYIARDADDRLRATLGQGGLVLLVGDSTAGKTRAAYEAVREQLARHVFVAPADRPALARIVPVVAELHRAVVWLDDLERFLGVDGLTPAVVRRMTSGDRDVRLVATLRSPEYDRLVASTDPSDGSRSTWRDARDVLGLASVVELPRQWSDAELARAREHDDDPRIRGAVRNAGRFGVAELLAAGPDLARAWQAGWSPGAHPRGAALVAAAVDCRRAGVHEPQPVEFLALLAESYLRQRDGALLRPEPLDEAVRWATAPAHGASSLLVPTGDDGRLLAFDYLIDVGGLDRVPQETWTALIDQAAPGQAFDIGEAAAQRFINDIAVLAFRRAAAGGIADADVTAAFYARLLSDGDAAISELGRLWRERERTLGPDAPETLRARLRLAQGLADPHDQAEAVRMFETLVPDLRRVFGPDDPATLDARRLHGYALGKVGKTATSLALLEELRRDHERVYGPDHHDTILTSHYIGSFLAETRPAEAVVLLAEVRDAYNRLLGPDSPRVLQTRTLIGQICGCSGEFAAAARLTLELASDRERILGRWHPHSLCTRLDAATWAFKAGEREAAGGQLQQLTTDTGEDILLHAVRSSSEHVHERIGISLLNARAETCRALLGAEHPLTVYLAGRAAAVVERMTSSGAKTTS
ncbi:tetratricopeptide repeat protein [Dactylosporangium sp. CA-139114]|uniref:tetratricopeptide repeat protein n=1 Tax=Dactylosporangium sp. CA-139114 TaxID=3239931 RepID=UPI003D952936